MLSTRIIVLFSSDRALSKALSTELASLDSEVEVHVVHDPETLTNHVDRLQPEALVIDDRDLEPLTLRATVERYERALVLTDAHHDSPSPLFGAVIARSNIPQAASMVLAAAGSRANVDGNDQHYRTILEASSDGIFVAHDGLLKFVNRSFAAALGRSASDLLGCPLLRFVSASDAALFKEHLARSQVAPMGHADRVDVELLTGRGPNTFELALQASVLSGKRVVVGVARDVTAFANLQDELGQGQSAAPQGDRLRMLGEIAAGVAHDFNNSLGTILGRVELALERLGEGGDPREELQVVEQTTRHAMQTVERIREFTSPGEQAPWEDLELGQLLPAAIAGLPGSDRKRVSLQVQPDLHLLGNAAELREVFDNLLRNATHALGDDGQVSVEAGRVDDTVVVSVRDNGHGMDPATAARIFEPFFSSKRGQGTGLGLSISRWLLQRHGATVEVESAAGKGSTFTLTFRPSPPANTVTHSAANGRFTVLVVEDDDRIGDLLRDQLHELGHGVTVVQDATTAGRALRDPQFNLLLTDLDLPDLGGWQLVRQVRRQRPGLRVGVVTGWSIDASPAELQRRGVDFLIQKPFTLTELEAGLDQARGA